MIGQKYEYKGQQYLFVREVSMKDTRTRVWHPAVMYTGKNIDGITPVYVRKSTDFHNKFKLLKA